jgi:L-arabinose isomerase
MSKAADDDVEAIYKETRRDYTFQNRMNRERERHTLTKKNKRTCN